MPRRDRRTEIMLAAERLLTRRRLHEISLDDLVREARVGKGTIYRHFHDKEDLFFQTATRAFDELCELVGGTVPTGAPFRRQLTGVCRRISDFFDNRRQMFRMIQSEDLRVFWHRPEMRQRWKDGRRRLVSAVAKVIRRGVAEGAVRSDVPAETLATLLLGLLRTRARDLAGNSTPQASVSLVAEFFCRGAASENGLCEAARRRKGGAA